MVRDYSIFVFSAILKDMKQWQPNRSVSTGATAYHNAVVHTSWHKNNINGLRPLIKTKIKRDDVVVDFGAGTGASAIYFLKNIKKNFKLLLVDNSPSWLTKAYDLLHDDQRVGFFLLEKKDDRFMTLDEVIGKESVDHVVSANTVHLIPDIEETCKGIYSALKDGGTFTFQSGNIIRDGREKGILMIDDSVREIHALALNSIQADSHFKKYTKDLAQRIEEEKKQRSLIFPHPRSLDYYVKCVESAGFKHVSVSSKRIKVAYKDWLDFLRVRRLQAGILPEIGGRDATVAEEHDRDILITKASRMFFKNLRTHNRFANTRSFTAEWIYVYAEK